VGVLVAVGVAVGAGEKSDAKGQLQAMVSIIATTVIHRAVALFAFKSAVLLSRSVPTTFGATPSAVTGKACVPLTTWPTRR